MTSAVSVQLPLVHMNPYAPITLNPVIVVVGLLGDVIVDVPELLGMGVHVPVPVAASVAVLLSG
jgi:hypothetical protein